MARIILAASLLRSLHVIMLCIRVTRGLFTLCDDPFSSWNCDNGECINAEHVCDGVRHCHDGSDETALNCIGVNCPSYAFRCAYGACVPGVSKCNDIKDCDDNSDEMPFLCESNEARTDSELKLRGICSEYQFQCGSGECLDSDLRCDGRPDCVDGSDESVKWCFVNFCPEYSFQCGYGACVRGSSKCDGIGDCVDSSDEAYVLCNTTRPLPSKPTTPTPSDGKTCQIPWNVKNLKVLNRNLNVILHPGERVLIDTILRISCEPGFQRINEEDISCLLIGWSNPWPYCTKLCKKSGILHGFSTEADCYKNSTRVNCNNNLYPGTQAYLGCAIRFKKPKKFNSVLTCDDRGEWNVPRISCDLDCGRITATTKAYAANASPVDISKVPWHVGIYSRYDRISYNYTCGGTIISPNIVLSAAHCFWDDANDEIFRETLFLVVAGKYYRDLKKNEGNNYRNNNVSKIYTPNYHHRANYYLNDLAVLILEKVLRFSDAIAPVCLNLDINDVTTGAFGHFVGWGFTEENHASDELRRANISTLSHDECIRRLAPAQSPESTYKLAEGNFCLHNEFGVSACRGDSGGGFVIAATDDDGEPYYRLLGIISHTPLREDDCATDGVVAMTNVGKYRDFIMTYIRNEGAKDF